MRAFFGTLLGEREGMDSTKRLQFDALVVGGGIAGLQADRKSVV